MFSNQETVSLKAVLVASKKETLKAAICLYATHNTQHRRVVCICRLSSVIDEKDAKTYNSGDSLVVTHLTTNPPVHCLYMAERTGSLIFSVLWSYVEENNKSKVYSP